MNSTELRDQFRLDVVDTLEPYLWSDAEVYSYIDSAQKQFCRLVGGIGDGSSPATIIDAVTGTEWYSLSPLVLKVRGATLANGKEIEVINYEDIPARGLRFDGRRSHVKYLVTGIEPGRVRVYPIPDQMDTIQMVIDRLPLKTIDDADQKLEIQSHHKEGLGLWIRHRAYSKQDAETLNRTAAAENLAAFNQYCAFSKAERDRAKHKTRVVAYGGL